MKTRWRVYLLLMVFWLASGGASRAVLLVYEGFNYPIGTNGPDPDGGTNGGNGLPATNEGGEPAGTGTGLRGAWGETVLVREGLAYVQGSNVLATSGGAGAITNAGWGQGVHVYRFMRQDPFQRFRTGQDAGGSLGEDGTVLYVSLLIKLDEGWAPGTVAQVAIGAEEANGNIYVGVNTAGVAGDHWGMTRGATGDGAATSAAAKPGETVLLVLRYTFGAANADQVELWVNPPLRGELGNAMAVVSGGNFAITGFNTRPSAARAMAIDELRVGETAADVMPLAGP
mgnify:CR=1 FL=1